MIDAWEDSTNVHFEDVAGTAHPGHELGERLMGPLAPATCVAVMDEASLKESITTLFSIFTSSHLV